MTEAIYSDSAKKSLKKIPQNYRDKIIEIIDTDLKANPFQNDILKNTPKLRRHKKNIGNYRIIYMILDDETIDVLDILLIGHRKDIYQKMKRINIR